MNLVKFILAVAIGIFAAAAVKSAHGAEPAVLARVVLSAPAHPCALPTIGSPAR